jgi:hypothetical protein
MPPLTAEQELSLGLTPPARGEKEPDSKTKITRLAVLDSGVYRRRINLSEDDYKLVTELLWDCYREWDSNTSLLRSKLLKYNNRLEGISSPRTDPWPGACSLMVPLIEIHIVGLHSLITATMLDNDPIWFVKEMVPPTAAGGDMVDPNIEWFLNYKSKVELNLDESLSEAFYNALATPLGLGVMDWVEEKGKEFHVEVFEKEFPSPEEAGCSPAQYVSFLTDLAQGKAVHVKREEEVVRYRGPRLRIVELKDLVRAPVDAPSLEYTVFHGDMFRQRANYFRVGANRDWFDKDEVEEMLKTAGETSPMDKISQQQNRNEGLSSTPIRKADEYYCVRGNLRIDLNGDGEEEFYHVVFHPKTKRLLRIEDYPYWHNRINYIPFRIRKKSGRLLGRCITDMLWDLNEETDTQHHLRIDSRAISTVPSFKKKLSETSIDFSRKDQHFYPGVVFEVNAVDGLTQLEITQTDMGTSMQEEQTLFQLAVWLIGNDPGLRSGTPQTKDPRASGKKTQQQLQQSNVRVDDYIRQLMVPTNEVGSQTLELYYQFAPDAVLPYAQYSPETGQWMQKEIQRVKLRNKAMTVKVARTSVMDNPDALLQRALTNYQLWANEPLIGGNMQRRHELVRRTLFAEREKDISKLLPNLQQIIQEMNQAKQQASQDPAAAQIQNTIEDKTKGGGSGDKAAVGKKQGGPDLSAGALGKKAPGGM